MVVQCSKCSFTYHYRSKVQAHQNLVHSDLKPWKCTFPMCTYRTKSEKYLKNHQRVHETDPEVKKPYPCTVQDCDYRACTTQVLAGHIKSRHTNGKTRDFQCPLCPGRFYDLSALKSHVAIHTREIKFACRQCNFRTHLKDVINSHVEQFHAQAKKFQCSFPGCNASCLNPSALRNHHRRIHGTDPAVSRPFPCSFPTCTYRAALTAELKRHIHVRHNPNRKRQFPCSLCSKEFYDKNGLRTHIHNVHINESKYSCEECNFTTKNRFRLRDHVRVVHVEGPGRERKFKCDTCDYRACDTQRLQRHQDIVHNSDRKYSCEEPGCVFRTNFLYYFKEHRTIHEDDPKKKFPFSCSFPSCNFRRRVRYEMTTHEKRHARCESQFECTLCGPAIGRFYPDTVSLKFHIFLCHNKGVSFSCQLCRFVGVSKRSLSGHMQRLHGNTKNPDQCHTEPQPANTTVGSRRPEHSWVYAAPIVVLQKVVLKVI